jgi:hypothetical protein
MRSVAAGRGLADACGRGPAERAQVASQHRLELIAPGPATRRGIALAIAAAMPTRGRGRKAIAEPVPRVAPSALRAGASVRNPKPCRPSLATCAEGAQRVALQTSDDPRPIAAVREERPVSPRGFISCRS